MHNEIMLHNSHHAKTMHGNAMVLVAKISIAIDIRQVSRCIDDSERVDAQKKESNTYSPAALGAFIIVSRYTHDDE